jgi:hypothetical protein
MCCAPLPRPHLWGAERRSLHLLGPADTRAVVRICPRGLKPALTVLVQTPAAR